jgi:hypothetical protein
VAPLEVSAIREVDVKMLVVRAPAQFIDKRPQRKLRIAPPVCGFPMLPRIAEPPTEADVEERKQERERGGGVVAHVRTGRRSGDRHRSAERDSSRASIEAARTIAETAVAAVKRAMVNDSARRSCQASSFPLSVALIT